jgi:hypothetical protein
MNEEVPLLPAIVGLLLVTYLGFEITRRRGRLREEFNVFDSRESVIAEALEGMVARGELTPLSPL